MKTAFPTREIGAVTRNLYEVLSAPMRRATPTLGRDCATSVRAPRCLTYEDAAAIGKVVLSLARDADAPCEDNAIALDRRQPKRRFCIDFSGCLDTTMQALAQLVVLRRHLLGLGCDLTMTGLQGRARSVYDVNRLQAVLPTV